MKKIFIAALLALPMCVFADEQQAGTQSNAVPADTEQGYFPFGYPPYVYHYQQQQLRRGYLLDRRALRSSLARPIRPAFVPLPMPEPDTVQLARPYAYIQPKPEDAGAVRPGTVRDKIHSVFGVIQPLPPRVPLNQYQAQQYQSQQYMPQDNAPQLAPKPLPQQ